MVALVIRSVKGSDLTPTEADSNINELAARIAASGLVDFVEAVSVATPNATRPVVSLTAVNAATDVDAAIRPKGSGALTAQVADNTTTGGNKRGTKSVDLQMGRSAATMVASGAQASIGGGLHNTGSGDSSTIPGGTTNTASGQAATVGGGQDNLASGVLSTIPGGYLATTRGIYGMQSYASGSIGGGVGGSQRSALVLRIATSNATPLAMTSDGGAAAATNMLTLPNNSSALVRGYIHCRDLSGTATVSSWQFIGTIKRDGNAASTAIVGTITPTLVSQDAGASSWGPPTVTANTTLGSLSVNAVGLAATSLRWTCVLESVDTTNA